jgi:predicted dehydrogenase
LKPVRAAVVGLDRPGILHAAILSSIADCEVVGVADARREARRNLRGMGCAAPGFASLERLLEKTSPEAVIVCAPLAERAALARRALEAKAAVLIEPPLATTAAQASEITRFAADQGLALACAHELAFRPVFTHAHRVIASGALGEVKQVRSSLYLSRVFSSAQKRVVAPHEGDGVVALAASDLIFLLLWYFGVPVDVRATAHTLYGGAEDECHGTMRLASGAEIGFDTSWSVPGYPRAAAVMEVEAVNGKLLVSDDALELDLEESRAGLARGFSKIAHSDLPQLARFALDGEARYLEDAAFLEWATGGPAPPTRAEASLAVVRVMEALFASARSSSGAVPVAA